MELIEERVLVFVFAFSFCESLFAFHNELFQLVELIKKRNPSYCSIASFRTSTENYNVTCVDNDLNKYLYQIPLTVDSKSSFMIDANRYMDINDGMDSIFLAGRFMGRAIKVNSKNEDQKNVFNKADHVLLPLPEHYKSILRLLDNETAPELGPFYRVVVDHIKDSQQDYGIYTTRIIDCQNDAYINISKGMSVEEMEKKYGPPGNLKPISKNSILYHLRNEVCGKINGSNMKGENTLDKEIYDS